MGRETQSSSETRLAASLVDTSKSTIKMLVELWYALWHDSHH